MDDHKTLALVGEKNVRHAYVVSGHDRIKMIVLITGGPQGRLETPMLIIKNVDNIYLIRGLPDNAPGVTYHIGTKSWVHKRVFLEWVRERHVFASLPNGRMRVLYVDNVNTHCITYEDRTGLNESKREIRFFPCIATHHVQPDYSFRIQKLKRYWRTKWDDFKMNSIEKGLCSDGERGSGKLSNPAKKHF